METIQTALHETIEDALAMFRHITEEASGSRPDPESWSAKEILGHLIDSAAQNHRRFLDLYGRDHLKFPPYEQEQWVRVQRYADRPWQALVEFWHAYNLHLAHLLASLPNEEFTRPRHPHNLDRFTTPVAPAEAAVTLADLVRHYIDHLKAHLGQIRQAQQENPR